MIAQLPTALLHDVIIKSNNPSIFAASRELNALSTPVLQTLAPEVHTIHDGNMAAYVCNATPDVATVLDLHPAVRDHAGIAQLMITRTAGFDYENFPASLASDLDIADAALQASEGYIFGMMPPALQADPDVILTAAQAFQIDTEEGTTVQELSEVINGIVLNAWEDIDDIRESLLSSD